MLRSFTISSFDCCRKSVASARFLKPMSRVIRRPTRSWGDGPFALKRWGQPVKEHAFVRQAVIHSVISLGPHQCCQLL